MGKFTGCLLACDIDGTTLINGYLPPRNIEAMEYFKSEGGRICIATGRTIPALPHITKLYNGYGPSVVNNGSIIYDTIDDKILYSESIAERETEVIKQVIKVAPNVGIEVHVGRDVYTLRKTPETDDHQTYEKMVSKDIKLEEVAGIGPNKILYLFNSEEEQTLVKSTVINEENASSFSDTLVTLYDKKRRYLEQMPKGVSKAKTILKMMKMFDMDPKNLFAIGDGFNDIEMLNTAAVSACPEGSPKEVKAAADITVCKASDGAVADFIEILKRRM